MWGFRAEGIRLIPENHSLVWLHVHMVLVPGRFWSGPASSHRSCSDLWMTFNLLGLSCLPSINRSSDRIGPLWFWVQFCCCRVDLFPSRVLFTTEPGLTQTGSVVMKLCSECFPSRNRMALLPSQAFYLLVSSSSLASMSLTMAQLYQDHQDDDGFLYMTYASQEMFGLWLDRSSAGLSLL